MNQDLFAHLAGTGLFSEIDLYFARFIGRLSADGDPDVFLGAALVSRATGNGDICLDLDSVAETVLFEKQDGTNAVICPPLGQWRNKLYSSAAVGRPGEICPLILDDRNRLYLYRYWEYEKKLSSSITARVKQDAPQFNLQGLKQRVKRLFPQNDPQEIDWQKVAAAVAILKRFSVVTGGPGSGKTFTIARILALILEVAHPVKPAIFLAAPTGKAAARLGEAIKQAKQALDCSDRIKNIIPTDVYTIHRLLKPIGGTPYFRHNSDNQLPADVVVVDEASMVDLALMSKLAQAVPINARLMLFGDKDQLASVEAGSVLGDICDRNVIHGFSKQFAEQIESVSGEKISHSIRVSAKAPALHDCIVILRKSYRFTPTSGIGGLSRAVNRGESEASLALLNDAGEKSIAWRDVRSHGDLIQGLAKRIIDGYSRPLKLDDPFLALEAFNRFKILCALKIGPFGAGEINRLAEQVLRQHHLIRPNLQPDNSWYKGRPVLITKNDYNLGLFNGDIGITMPDPNSSGNELYVYFPGASGVIRRFLPHRLPEHQTVYAMTVHKSQGSEFDEVILILPDKDYPVLTRELIYTGLTRARQKVSIWGMASALKTAIALKIERTSGLRDALWRQTKSA